MNLSFPVPAGKRRTIIQKVFFIYNLLVSWSPFYLQRYRGFIVGVPHQLHSAVNAFVFIHRLNFNF